MIYNDFTIYVFYTLMFIVTLLYISFTLVSGILHLVTHSVEPAVEMYL